MKIEDFVNFNSFGIDERFKDFEIEDFGFFSTMRIRMIEDTAIVTYVLAKEKGLTAIEEPLMQDTLRLLDQDEALPFSGIPENGVVITKGVRDYATSRVPIQYTDGAIDLFSRFLNFHLIAMLREAAEQTEQDGLKTIKLRHVLPGCDKWPWPLNLIC